MYELPISITINNKKYPIRNKGDYRVILDCFSALNDIDMPKDVRIITSLMIFLDGVTDIECLFSTIGEENLQTAVTEMYHFFNCGSESVGAVKPYKLLDWEQDEQIIISAINNVANKEVRLEPYIHWWTFMGYYLAIGDCTLANVVAIRDKMVRGKKLEKYEREFQADNPHYFNWNRHTIEQQEEDAFIQDLWNSE